MSRDVSKSQPKIPLTVLVVTRNEESNIERCLRSVHDLADQLLAPDLLFTVHLGHLASKADDLAAHLARLLRLT